MSNAFVTIKMCYVYNQWYDISCATLYLRIWEDNIKLLVLVRICIADSGQVQVTGRCEHGSEPSLS